MDDQMIEKQDTKNISLLKAPLILIGFMFILTGVSITLGISYAVYQLLSQPDQFANLMQYVTNEKEIFIKWITNGKTEAVELSSIISLVFIAIAASMVIRTTILFINMTISSGRTLLNLSRNFD